MKKILFFFFLVLIIKISKEEEVSITLDEYYDTTPQSKQEIIKKLLNKYIQSKKWEPEKQLTNEIFTEMFVDIIQKSPLKQTFEETAKRLAENTIKKHEGPILVKNLDQYFNFEELSKTYLELFNPQQTTDL